MCLFFWLRQVQTRCLWLDTFPDPGACCGLLEHLRPFCSRIGPKLAPLSSVLHSLLLLRHGLSGQAKKHLWPFRVFSALFSAESDPRRPLCSQSSTLCCFSDMSCQRVPKPHLPPLLSAQTRTTAWRTSLFFISTITRMASPKTGQKHLQ